MKFKNATVTALFQQQSLPAFFRLYSKMSVFDTIEKTTSESRIRGGMLELENLTIYRRYLLEESNLLIVRGGIAPVIAGMNAYNARYGISSLHEGLKSHVTELLAGAALAAVSLAGRESWGWSLAFGGMDVGFFVGVEPEGMICLRIVESDKEKASGLIQRQKAGLPLTQSYIHPRTQNPADAIRQYFKEVEQTKTRIEIRADGEGALVHALPNGVFDAFEGLDADALFTFIDASINDGKLKDAGEVLIFYQCRCSEEMIARMVENMKDSDRQEMFGDLLQLEIECPRCGRKHTVTRTARRIH
jgi:molecular chaperone Hsp33